jgi:hypothetical protein
MNKNMEKGFTARAHVHRILSRFNHWPTEALEATTLKLPTLRFLRLAGTVQGLDFENLPGLQEDNEVATIIRSASQNVDKTRQDKKNTLQRQIGTKEFDKLVRQH